MEEELNIIRHAYVGQGSDHTHIVAETGSEKLKALSNLIDEAITLHIQLQIVSEEIHGHSEISRACRGILRDLYRLGPQTVPQLTRGRPVSRQNVLMLVNRLVAEQLAEFVRNPEHKRSHLVRLTSRGKALLENMWNRETALLNALDPDIPVEDIQKAAHVMRRLREVFEDYRIKQAK